MEPIVLTHPLVKHKLAVLRDKNLGTKEFREIAAELATMLCYEATKDAPLYETEIETPIAKMKAEKLDEDIYAFLPILRAGMSMVEGILNIIPNAKVGHIGLFRNEETLEPTQYYFKVPSGIENRTVIILDPMIATGGSAVDAIESLKKIGVKKIKFLAIIAVPEGLKRIIEAHPDVEIYCASIDSHLNEHGYIVPGLGDAGDRIYGTK